MNILVVDVGGTNLKLRSSASEEVRKVPSGPTMTPQDMIDKVKQATADWRYDVVSVGYPGPVVNGYPIQEPYHLAPGWVKFDFPDAFGNPTKVINDAAMQALGSYEGGRMLFLGLGTGLGSTLVIDNVLAPLELAHLPYRKKTFEDYVGARGLERLGKHRWRQVVEDVVARLKAAMVADYVILGGGNTRKIKDLPPGTRRGNNNNAFIGGFRLWQTRPSAKKRSAGGDA